MQPENKNGNDFSLLPTQVFSKIASLFLCTSVSLFNSQSWIVVILLSIFNFLCCILHHTVFCLQDLLFYCLLLFRRQSMLNRSLVHLVFACGNLLLWANEYYMICHLKLNPPMDHEHCISGMSLQQNTNLQFMIVNSTILIGVEEVKRLVHLLFLLLSQFSSLPHTRFPVHRTQHTGPC